VDYTLPTRFHIEPIVKTGDGFTVYTKSGRINSYVQNPTGISSVNQKTKWFLAKEEDSYGNGIDYTYELFGFNEILLKSINYTGGNVTTNGNSVYVTGDRKIVFSYLSRIDSNVSYLAGEKTGTTQRLTEIRTYTPNNYGSPVLARTYTFDSSYSKVTNKLLLESVKEKSGTIERDLLLTSWSQDEDDSGWEEKLDSNGSAYLGASTVLDRISLEGLNIVAPDYRDDWYNQPKIFKNGIQKLTQTADINGNGVKEVSISGRLYNETLDEYEVFSYTVEMDSFGKPKGMPWSGAVGDNFTNDFDNDGRLDYSYFKELPPNSDGLIEYELVISKWLSSGGDVNCSAGSTGFTPICSRLSLEGTGFKLDYLPNIRQYQLYDDDNDGDFDLFVMEDINYYYDGTPCKYDSNRICDSLLKYENTSGSFGTFLFNLNKTNYAYLERINFQGYSYNLDTNIITPLFYQTFEGMKDINADGIPEIIIRNIFTTNTAGRELNYLGKDTDGNYRRIMSAETSPAYHKFIDINKDGLEDLLVIHTDENQHRTWAVRLNTGGEIFTTIDGVEQFNSNLFSQKIISSNSNFLSDFNGYQYGFPSQSGCNGCSPKPFRSDQNRQFDINSDGTDEILIPDNEKLYWNSCRGHVLAPLCTGCLPTKVENRSSDILLPFPAKFFEAQSDIQEILDCRDDPNCALSRRGANGIAFVCSDDEKMLPGTITVGDDVISGNYYQSNGDIPYLGSTDNSIYGYKALNFSLIKDNGLFKLQVKEYETDFMANVRNSQVGDINNDGLQDFYSSFGCEWKGCLSSGYKGQVPEDTLIDSSANSSYDNNLGLDSVFASYISDTYTGNSYLDKQTAFKRDIKEQSSFAINKVTADMPDMLVRVTKPALNTQVEWDYAPLSTDNSDSTDPRVNFPIYSVPDRDSGDSYVDEDDLAGDHFYFNSSMYVVAEMRQTNNYGNNAVTQYAYEEAVYNNKGRGFQGFRKISVKSKPQDNSVYETLSESTFHQVFPYAGKLEKIEVFQLDSTSQYALTQSDLYQYKSNQSITSNKKVHFHPLASKFTTNLDITDGSPISESISNNLNYDNYGNLITQSSSVISYLPDAVTNTQTTTTNNNYYLANETDWWVDKLRNTTVTKTLTTTGANAVAGNHTTSSQFNWNSAALRQLDCQITGLNTQAINKNCTSALSSTTLSRNIFTYDDYGNIKNVKTQAIEENNQQERIVETTYTSDGYFPQLISKVINPSLSLDTHLSYEKATGQVTQTTDPNGNTVDTFYDAYGFKTKQTQNAITNFAQDVYTRIENCNATNCSTEQGIVASIAAAYQGALDSNTNTPINGMIGGAPQLVYRTEQRQNGQPQVITYFDSSNNPVITKTIHSNEQFNYQVTIVSPRGQSVITTQAFNDISSNVANAYPTVNLYDELGRVVEKTTTIGGLNTAMATYCTLNTLYTHTGAQTEIIAGTVNSSCNFPTDVPNNLLMSRVYDATGKLISTTDAQNNTVKYWYDHSGNPYILQDANGNQINTNFDALGRKISVNDPNMGTKTFSYNGFGEVQRQYDGSKYTLYSYDSLGRITKQLSNVDINGVPDANLLSYKDIYIFDKPGALGQLETTARYSNYEANQTTTFSTIAEYIKAFSYDQFARPTTETTTIYNALVKDNQAPSSADDQAIYSTHYLYDANFNRVKQVNYYGGYGINSIYGKYGNLKAQKEYNAATGWQNIMSVDAYNFKGQETARTVNGTASSTAYYPATGQIAQIINYHSTGAETLSYQYDVWGNIKEQTLNRTGTQAANATENFVYDSLHRLTEDTNSAASASKSYSYDVLGNITSKSDFSLVDNNSNYIYGAGNAGPNAVTHINLLDGTSMDYSYDYKGNRINDCRNLQNCATYKYDYNNLLIASSSAITGTSQTLEFSYGTDNQRYRKYDDINKEITLYANKDYEEIYKNGSKYASQRKYYLTSYLTVTKDGTQFKKHFTQKDRLGSTTQILDENGDLLHTKSYDAFGKPRNGDWSDMGGLFQAKLDFNDANGTIDLTKRGFTDHEHLDEIQLIHMNGRMYDYNNGRFLSVDPFIQSPTSTQSMNPYTYIFNNPLSGVDPSGYYSSVCVEGMGCIGTSSTPGKIPVGNDPYPGCPYCASTDGGKGNDDGGDSDENKDGDTSSIGSQEGIWDGVVVPAAKNLANDTVLGFQRDVQILNETIAAPFAVAGELGELIDDHQGELNTLSTLGLPGVEAEMGIIAAGNVLQTGTKIANLIKGGSNVTNNANNVFHVASDIGAVSSMQQVRIIQHGEKISDIVNEAKSLTFITGNEHALVTLANGSRALVSGGPGGISFNKGWVSRIFGHTHPTNAPPSAADAQALTQLGQSKQYVLHGGEVSVVRPKN